MSDIKKKQKQIVFIYFSPRTFVEMHLLLNSCRKKFSLISQIRESGG